MPSIGDITVQVTDNHGVPLQEWGVQHLRSSPRHTKVSAYIQSTTDTAFRIILDVNIPYTEHDAEEAIVTSMSDSGSSSNRSRSVTPPPPPFDLLATLYLDGRKKPERKVIVYLDPRYEDFKPGPGHRTSRQTMRHRWVRGNDGKIQEHAWVFKDIGIETILARMGLTSNNDSIALSEEDAITDALGRTGICHEDDLRREENLKVGQIEVTITRVLLGRKKLDRHFRPKHQEGEDEHIDMGDTKPEVTHTAAVTPVGTFVPRDVEIVTYETYHDEHEPFAVFKFFYRSQEILEKFNFPGFKLSPKKPVRKPHVNSQMNNLTPLSISSGYALTSTSKRHEEKAFEDQLREGGFKTDQPPQYNYDDLHNRLTSADFEESSQTDNSQSSDDEVRPSQMSGIRIQSSNEADKASAWAGTVPDEEGSGLHGCSQSSAQQTGRPRRRRYKGIDTPPAEQDTGSNAMRPLMLGSNDSVSNANPYSASVNKGFGSFNPNAPNNASNPFSLGRARPLTVANRALRDDSSSDADDEQEAASDLESHGSGDDIGPEEYDAPSLDLDDKGLHEDLTLRLQLKRTRDADGESDDGQGKLARAKNAGDAAVGLSTAVNVPKKPKTKRVKVDTGSLGEAGDGEVG